MLSSAVGGGRADVGQSRSIVDGHGQVTHADDPHHFVPLHHGKAPDGSRAHGVYRVLEAALTRHRHDLAAADITDAHGSRIPSHRDTPHHDVAVGWHATNVTRLRHVLAPDVQNAHVLGGFTQSGPGCHGVHGFPHHVLNNVCHVRFTLLPYLLPSWAHLPPLTSLKVLIRRV